MNTDYKFVEFVHTVLHEIAQFYQESFKNTDEIQGFSMLINPIR